MNKKEQNNKPKTLAGQNNKPKTLTATANVEKLIENHKVLLKSDCLQNDSKGSCTHTGWSD